MDSMIAVLGMGIVLFVTTNIDDVFVLLGFFSDPKFGTRQIVIGQYVGIAVLFAASAVASMLAVVVPAAYIGLLGLFPIAIGAKKLYLHWRKSESDEHQFEERVQTASGDSNVLTVAAVTMANGGDNISIYTPLFATRSVPEVAMIGLVFAVMTALWCVAGHWLVHHPSLGAPIRRYGHRIVPFVLIGLGFFILYEAGTFGMLGLGAEV